MVQLTCLYVADWHDNPGERGARCNALITPGSLVRLCPTHQSLVCETCGAPATRNINGKKVCLKASCE